MGVYFALTLPLPHLNSFSTVRNIFYHFEARKFQKKEFEDFTNNL